MFFSALWEVLYNCESIQIKNSIHRIWVNNKCFKCFLWKHLVFWKNLDNTVVRQKDSKFLFRIFFEFTYKSKQDNPPLNATSVRLCKFLILEDFSVSFRFPVFHFRENEGWDPPDPNHSPSFPLSSIKMGFFKILFFKKYLKNVAQSLFTYVGVIHFYPTWTLLPWVKI